jgi:hypothetical protein
MAIDTRNKRASCFGCGLRFRMIYPQADGTIGAADRLQVLALYASGIVGQSEPPPPAASPQQPVGRLLDIAEPVGRLV